MPDFSNGAVTIQARSNPMDAMWANFSAPFQEGTEPFTAAFDGPTEVVVADLIPNDLVVMSAKADNGHTLLVQLVEGTALILAWPARTKRTTSGIFRPPQTRSKPMWWSSAPGCSTSLMFPTSRVWPTSRGPYGTRWSGTTTTTSRTSASA